MPEIIVFQAPANNRSRIVAEAMHRGLLALGEDAELRSSLSHRGRIEARVAVFYGLATGLRRVFEDYRTGAKAIYIDLGYWGRRIKSRWDGYHKFALNDRHPTAYFQRRQHAPDRFARFGLPIAPWRSSGGHIVLAGMSAKAAAAERLGSEQWERAIVQRLRKITRRPIVYRPKPNWPGARRIEGTRFEQGLEIEASLRGAHALITHHSNVAIDALLLGIPVFCPFGAASIMAEPCLENIEQPRMPDGREQWASDLAYCQFSIAEMESGEAWTILKAEGLV